jgi:hypothetical protein
MAPTSAEEIGKTSKILSRIWACYTTFSSKKKTKNKSKNKNYWHVGLDESFSTH